MTLKNAIKKLEKLNWTITSVHNHRLIEAIKGTEVIEFNYHQGENPDIWGIVVRAITDKSDVQSDYFAGTPVRNLSSAIAISN